VNEDHRGEKSERNLKWVRQVKVSETYLIIYF